MLGAAAIPCSWQSLISCLRSCGSSGPAIILVVTTLWRTERIELVIRYDLAFATLRPQRVGYSVAGLV